MVFRLLSSLIRFPGRMFAKKNSALPVEVSACLPALEVLGRQIVAVAEKGNESTEDLGRSFADMATQANELVHQVNQGNEEESGIAGVQEVLTQLLSKFKDTNRATSATGETLGQIESELRRIESCASEVEDIARRARLVSFNGRIEAEAAGVHGPGFAVVAEETGKLAMTITQTSQEIGEAVSRLTTTLRATSDGMKMLVENGSLAAEECENKVNLTLDQLLNYQGQLEANLDSARATGDSLSNAISRSIMGLQFQDAVSQRMQHVSNSLEDIRTHFSEIVPTTNQSEKRAQVWLEKISDAYCVADQRQIHEGLSSPDTGDSESNIELF